MCSSRPAPPLLLFLLLFLLLLPPDLWAYEVSQYVEGRLAKNEAKYYKIETSGLAVVVLISDKGDADIYVSTVDREPNDERCEFSSDSCGVDLVVVPAPADTRHGHVRPVFVGVVGLEWHEETRYRLLLITPSSTDIQKYQVFETDPETGALNLMVTFDPLQIANDPDLHQLLEQLVAGGNGGAVGAKSPVAEWVWFLLLKGLEITFEIVL